MEEETVGIIKDKDAILGDKDRRERSDNKGNKVGLIDEGFI